MVRLRPGSRAGLGVLSHEAPPRHGRRFLSLTRKKRAAMVAGMSRLSGTILALLATIALAGDRNVTLRLTNKTQWRLVATAEDSTTLLSGARHLYESNEGPLALVSHNFPEGKLRVTIRVRHGEAFATDRIVEVPPTGPFETNLVIVEREGATNGTYEVVTEDEARATAEAERARRQEAYRIGEEERQRREAEEEAARVAEERRQAKERAEAAARFPRVLVASLVDAWDENEVRAEEAWLGKDLAVVGRVGKVFANDGTPYVTIVSTGPRDRLATGAAVACVIDTDQAKKLDPGAPIIVSGQLAKLEAISLFRYSWQLKDCMVLQNATQELTAACRKLPGAGECKSGKK